MEMNALTTNELWNEARKISITIARLTPTSLQIDWIPPTDPTVYNGQVVLLSEAPFDASNFPTDGVRYTASTDFLVPADQINQAHVISALYGTFNDDLTIVSAIVTNIDPNKIYYASVHGCSNILQYYPVGIQSYPLESSHVERKSSSYTGDIPHADAPPTTPSIGQVYYNPASNTVLMWNGAAWIQASSLTVETGSSYPSAPVPGQFFYNINTKNLDIWNGTSWVKANTFEEGTPSYNKLGTGTDGSYDERARLIKTLKTQLGWPAVCVELSEDNFNVAIDNALDTFRQRADNAYEHRHILFPLKAGQSIYYLNDPVVGTDRIVNLIKINRVSTIGMNALGGDNGIYAQIFYNQFFHGAMIDILSIHLAHSLSEEFERIFTGNLVFDWNESSRQLQILRKIYKDEKIVMECAMERTEQELLVDRWTKQWIQSWAHAELKEMLGMVRSKYSSGLPGAGGGLSLNGDTLLSEARLDFEECLRQITDFEVGNGGTEYGNVALLMG